MIPKGIRQTQSQIPNTVYVRAGENKFKDPYLLFYSGNMNLLFYCNFIIPFGNMLFPMLTAVLRFADSTVTTDAGIEPGPLQLMNWQSDALTTRLDLIRLG